MPFRGSRLGFLSAGIDPIRRRNNNDGEEPRTNRLLGPRWHCRRGPSFGMIDYQGGRKRNDHERAEAPPWATRLRHLPGGIFRSGGLQTNGGATDGRRYHFCRVTFVSAPPDKTSRAAKTNVGGEMEPRGAWAALPPRVCPAGFSEQTGQNERRRNA